MQRFLPLIMVFLSVLGIADASYLTYEKLSGAIPVCGQGFDCGTVLASSYAQLGPVPVSALGVAFYLTILILSCCVFLNIKLPKLNVTLLLKLCASGGFAFSLILIGLMAFVIQAWCLYCLVSAGTSTLLFILSLFLAKSKT